MTNAMGKTKHLPQRLIGKLFGKGWRGAAAPFFIQPVSAQNGVTIHIKLELEDMRRDQWRRKDGDLNGRDVGKMEAPPSSRKRKIVASYNQNPNSAFGRPKVQVVFRGSGFSFLSFYYDPTFQTCHHIIVSSVLLCPDYQSEIIERRWPESTDIRHNYLGRNRDVGQLLIKSVKQYYMMERFSYVEELFQPFKRSLHPAETRIQRLLKLLPEVVNESQLLIFGDDDVKILKPGNESGRTIKSVSNAVKVEHLDMSHLVSMCILFQGFDLARRQVYIREKDEPWQTRVLLERSVEVGYELVLGPFSVLLARASIVTEAHGSPS